MLISIISEPQVFLTVQIGISPSVILPVLVVFTVGDLRDQQVHQRDLGDDLKQIQKKQEESQRVELPFD